MSLYTWYSDEPVEPKYIQISHQGLQSFCKKNNVDFEAFRAKIHDHHAQPVTKDGMFIVERFFSGDVIYVVGMYLKSKGYTLAEDFMDADGESIVVGYDGVLVNWTW